METNPQPNPQNPQNQQNQQQAQQPSPNPQAQVNIRSAADQAMSPLPTSRGSLNVNPSAIENRNVMPRFAEAMGTEFNMSDTEKERLKMVFFAMEDKELRDYAERYGLVYTNGQFQKAGIAQMAKRNAKKVLPSVIGTSLVMLTGYGAKSGVQRYQRWKESRNAVSELASE